MGSIPSVKDLLPAFEGQVPKKFLTDSGSAKIPGGKMEWNGNVYQIYPKKTHHSKITFTIKSNQAEMKMDKRMKREFTRLPKDGRTDAKAFVALVKNTMIAFHTARAKALRPH